MINNKGQTLVMFIILLPIIIGVCAFIIDIGIITYEKNKLQNIITLSYKDEVKVDKYLKLNGIKEYKKSENNNCTKITYYKDSLFGNIVGIKEYKISSKVCR